MNRTPIQVLVVDDSAVVRGLLAKALETDPAIRVAGTAMHGELALQWLRRNAADVVVMDVEMPVMDGLTALPLILEQFPHVQVVMASSLTYEGAETTVRALALGAAGCIAKPIGQSAGAAIERVASELTPLVRALADRNAPVPAAPVIPRTPQIERNVPPKLLVIGASTGGPRALSVVLSGLPVDVPLPILVVQHMPAMFTPMLARHLQKDTGRPCAEASHGGPLERGHTYVAPGDFHLEVGKRGERMVCLLNQGPQEHFCRPSVNPLFRSAANWYGSGVLAVMLTGMGDDGIEGTREVVAFKGRVVAQDQATSTVWGMPGAVVREGLAHDVLPLEAIAPAVLRLCLQEAIRR
ncbi:MAG TPA: chemotaxis response regulator protein-glutamate methylesterase [Planctomycetaceae bacterium]|nr:chemotaxis response regulator protein-glutamate methylesterase [Planctomycetaceae bacterium]